MSGTKSQSSIICRGKRLGIGVRWGVVAGALVLAGAAAPAAVSPEVSSNTNRGAAGDFHVVGTYQGQKADYWFRKGDQLQVLGDYPYVEPSPPGRPRPPKKSPPPKPGSGITITYTEKDYLTGRDTVWAGGMDGEWVHVRYRKAALWKENPIKEGWVQGALLRPMGASTDVPGGKTSAGEVVLALGIFLGALLFPVILRVIFGKGVALGFLGLQALGCMVGLVFALAMGAWGPFFGCLFLLLCLAGYMFVMTRYC